MRNIAEGQTVICYEDVEGSHARIGEAVVIKAEWPMFRVQFPDGKIRDFHTLYLMPK